MKTNKWNDPILYGILIALFIGTFIAFGSYNAFSDSNVSFSQSINAGTLSAQILSDTGQTIPSPEISLEAKDFSYTCQTGSTASIGTLGTNTERLYISNPAFANNGFTLTIAATDGSSAKWENTISGNSYDFNDLSNTGCDDGADGDSISGLMSIDPSVGSLFTDCGSCTSSGIVKGSPANFNSGTVDSITLLVADANSNEIWRGYITGIEIAQSIPGEQLADSYTMNFTLTATAS